MFYRIYTVTGAGDAMHVEDRAVRNTVHEAVSVAQTWARSVCGTARVERIVERTGERTLIARVRWHKGRVTVERCHEKRPYLDPTVTAKVPRRERQLRRRLSLVIQALS